LEYERSPDPPDFLPQTVSPTNHIRRSMKQRRDRQLVCEMP
jgi:hypothetical protein